MNFFKTLLNPSLKTPLLLCACVLAFAAADTTRARATEKWLRLSSEHFDMFSCASEDTSRKMLVQLEQFRVFFLGAMQAMTKGRVYDPRPLIFVFDTDAQYRSHGASWVMSRSIGMCMDGLFQPRILLSKQHGLGVIFHEYTHSLTAARLEGDLPPWFNEGLATVFETFKVSGDTVTFGAPDARRLRNVRQDTSLIPLGSLFAVSNLGGMPTYQVYSQSWLLMHYALCGRDNGVYNFNNMVRFLEESTQPGAVTSKAFASVFGSGYKKLEDALDDYKTSGKLTAYTAEIPAAPIDAKITARPATAEERAIELTGLHWRTYRASDTVTDNEGNMLALMKRYPENPRVYEILAEMQMPRLDQIKLRKPDKPAAAAYLRKAVAKNSTNPLVYIELLKDINIGSTQPLDFVMPEDMAAECTTLIDRALELAPDCMEAYEMLAIIESQKPVMRPEKINTVLTAIPSMRDPAKTNLALATIYWRLNRYNEAQAALNDLIKNPNSTTEMQQRARDLQQLIAKNPPNPPKVQRPPLGVRSPES